MKRDILQNQYKTTGLFKTFFADLICFFVVTVLSVGFCYAYFSDKVNVLGEATTATIAIDYRSSAAGTSLTNVTAQVNGGTSASLNGIKIAPGDKITITGNAVSIGDEGTTASATADVYILAELNIVNKDSAGNKIDEETVWYNVADNKVVYVERGLFQVGASVLTAGATQALSIPYTFEGDKYNENYAIITLTLTLHAHQKDFLDLADDYSNYSAVGTYSKESIYATHCITGRKRDVWTSGDATVTGLTLADLETDESGAYLINTCKDWMIMRSTATTDYHVGKTFKLNAYLDFNNNTTDKTIARFKGAFDGQGYTISNLYMERTTQSYFGLFNQINIENLALAQNVYIKNLGLDGVQLRATTTNYCGALVGTLRGGVVDNCFVVGASNYDSSIDYDVMIGDESGSYTKTGEMSIGGLIGFAYIEYSNDTTSCWVSNNFVRCNIFVNVNSSGGAERVAGIVGSFYPKMSEFQNCYFEGEISHIDEADAPKTALITAGANNYVITSNCFAISNSFVSDATSANKGVMPGVVAGYSFNNAYIDNTGLTSTDTNYNKVQQTGRNLTNMTLTIETFKSAGLMRDAFGWDTNIWATDIYSGTSGLLVLRVFYNF